MLKRIVMQVNGKIIALSSQVWALLTEQLWHPVSNLLASITQASLSAVNQFRNLLAQIALSFKALLVNLIIQVQLIKQGLINALRKAFQIGSQPQTTAPQTQRPALVQAKQKKKRVGKTK